ncbi:MULTISPECIES: RICIN domain-containing protein [unclassified Streptomyces]|uniref:RICIN domain-containing protein n=1 Tax=unclassified Streptomyces TaxID=2593676 RepID=UPI001BEC80FF|nr:MULTISPECIES: RICIN domain-containing protein [unclassified Streptomyces]MBT2408720.1 RICIN domain-containing protein [Streptomyces sp. ISL-21]MBT2612040.1 RICIN domain-containing protein [Streptomyces sp. ISL-87]
MRSRSKLSTLTAVCVSALTVGALAQPALADGSVDPAQENCNAASAVAPGSYGTGSLTWCIIAAQQSGQVKKLARENFVKGLLDMLTNHTGGQYNIMIFDTKGKNAFGDPWFVHHYRENLQNVAFQTDVEYNDETSREDQTYRIWIFSGGGSFTNEGDGGWGNWAFYGLWDRSGSTVNFRPTMEDRVVPGVPNPSTPFPGDTPVTPGVPAHPGPRPGFRADTAATEPASSGRPPIGTPVFLKTANNLAAVATSAAAGSTVVAGKPGDANSRWTFTDAGGGRYRITNGLGPDLTENTGIYFANVASWKGGSTQKWEAVHVNGDTYRIRISDQDCLTYDEDYKKLGVWTCDGSKAQQWTIAR